MNCFETDFSSKEVEVEKISLVWGKLDLKCLKEIQVEHLVGNIIFSNDFRNH